MEDKFLEVSCAELKRLDDSTNYMIQRMFGERIVFGVNGSSCGFKKDYENYKNLISNLKTLNKKYDQKLEGLIDNIFLDK